MDMENIFMALQLMVVGMATVFLILLIIIGLGKLLVKLTNATAPASLAPPAPTPSSESGEGIDASTKQILDMAIRQITGNKGHINQIKKL